MSQSRWRDLWSMSRPQLSTLVIFGGVLAVLAGAPAIAGLADRHDLPGPVIALSLVVLTAILSLVVVRSWFPKARRAREVARAAPSLGMRHTNRFRLPDSLQAMASLSALGSDRTYTNLVSGHREGSDVMLFDVNVSSQSGYSPGRVVTCAASRHALKAPILIIEPSHDAAVGHEVGGLTRVHSESLAFDRRYRVRTSDPRFASTVVDARMIAWLLDLEPHLSFELGGEWVMCCAPQVDPLELAGLIEALDAFRNHVPRAASSIYPTSPEFRA